MATTSPPHHLGEVCDATVALIDGPADRRPVSLRHGRTDRGRSTAESGATSSPASGGHRRHRARGPTAAAGVVIRAQVAFEETKNDRVAIVVSELRTR
jgi:DNA gyrase subunit A